MVDIQFLSWFLAHVTAPKDLVLAGTGVETIIKQNMGDHCSWFGEGDSYLLDFCMLEYKSE